MYKDGKSDGYNLGIFIYISGCIYRTKSEIKMFMNRNCNNIYSLIFISWYINPNNNLNISKAVINIDEGFDV